MSYEQQPKYLPMGQRSNLASINVIGEYSPTTIQSTLWWQPAPHVPNIRAAEQLPILFNEPQSSRVASFQVRYLDEHDVIRDDCLREDVAMQIPRSRIFKSSLTDAGIFKNVCQLQRALPYQKIEF